MRKLNSEDVELLVESISEDSIKLIPFVKKDVCIDILDEEYTPFGWSVEYKDGAMNGHFKVCRLGVRNPKNGEWTYKESTGMMELENNEKHYHKLVEANAFKRACKIWGVGRELNKISPIEVPLYEATVDGLGEYNLVNGEYKHVGKTQGSYNRVANITEASDGTMVCKDVFVMKNLLYHTDDDKNGQIGYFRIACGKRFVYTFNELSELEQKEAKIEEAEKQVAAFNDTQNRMKAIADFEVNRTFEGMDLYADCGPQKVQKKKLGDLSTSELCLVYSNTTTPEIKVAARNGCKARGINVS